MMVGSIPLKKLIAWAVNLAVLSFSIKWSLDNIHLSELNAAFQRIASIKVLLVATLNMLVLLAFACRLCVLLGCPIRAGFSVTCLGSGLNGLLPFRLGDVARIYYSKKFYGISAAKLAAVSFIEKLCDLSVLAVLIFTVAYFDGGYLIGHDFVSKVASLVLVAVIFLVVFLRYGHIAGKFLRFSKRMSDAVNLMQQHVRVSRRVEVFALTILMWAINIVVVYLGLRWFLPNVESGLLDATAVLLIIAFAIALPGAPAGLGVFEAGVLAYLKSVFSIGNEEALAAALLLHIAISLPSIFLCLVLILKPRKPPLRHG